MSAVLGDSSVYPTHSSRAEGGRAARGETLWMTAVGATNDGDLVGWQSGNVPYSDAHKVKSTNLEARGIPRLASMRADFLPDKSF